MVLQLMPKKTTSGEALGLFSRRPLKRSQALSEGTGGVKRQAPMQMSWTGRLVLFCLPPVPFPLHL